MSNVELVYRYLCRYNNRTYRVEDIDWSLNPNSTFEAKDGPIVYAHYYKKVCNIKYWIDYYDYMNGILTYYFLQNYDINIRDMRQPLLLCTSKQKEIKDGASTSKKCYLVPELCCMTGNFYAFYFH